MLFTRPDGERIRDLSQMRKFMPFVSPRRNDSLVLYQTEIELDNAHAFLAEMNSRRPEAAQATLFHLYLRAAALAISERPGVNRFVAGSRLWQRNHLAITFSAKLEILDGSPMVTVKRIFPEGESLEEMVDSILENLSARRQGRENRSDKEMKLALEFPPFVVKAGLWLLGKANHWNLLTRKMIDDDPLFATLFVANLGSVGLAAGYHHLWEYGTCSMFGVIGGFRKREDGVEIMNVNYSYDERIEDGMYGGIAMNRLKEKLENPEKLL
jgi:pyruvate/2-oxoglutarate dehydrogenase complex dihydrolipoamide acyltransferase (E2) component